MRRLTSIKWLEWKHKNQPRSFKEDSNRLWLKFKWVKVVCSLHPHQLWPLHHPRLPEQQLLLQFQLNKSSNSKRSSLVFKLKLRPTLRSLSWNPNQRTKLLRKLKKPTLWSLTSKRWLLKSLISFKILLILQSRLNKRNKILKRIKSKKPKKKTQSVKKSSPSKKTLLLSKKRPS